MESLGISLVEKIAKSNKPIYLANSNVCAKFISTRHGFKESEVQVISNGIELKVPKKNVEYWSKKISKKNGELIYVMVANFFPEKNHLYLLKAWLKFCEISMGKPKKLVLVGYSPNSSVLNEIKAFVYDYNISNVPGHGHCLT